MAHTDSRKTPGAPTTTNTPEPPGFDLKRYETFRGKELRELSPKLVAHMLFLRFGLLVACYPGYGGNGRKFSSLLKSEKAGGVRPSKIFVRSAITEQQVERLINFPLHIQGVRTLRPALPPDERDSGYVRPLLVCDVENAHRALSLHDEIDIPSARTPLDELAWGTKPHPNVANGSQCEKDLEEWRFHMQDRAMAVIDLNASKMLIVERFKTWLDQTLERRQEKLTSVGVPVERFDKKPSTIVTYVADNDLLPLIDLAFLLGPYHGHSYTQAWLENKLDMSRDRFRDTDIFAHVDRVLDFKLLTEMGGHMV